MVDNARLQPRHVACELKIKCVPSLCLVAQHDTSSAIALANPEGDCDTSRHCRRI
eukprot:COSAG03_NODE_9131_length_744_cov_0.742636_1_plen_54_part_01